MYDVGDDLREIRSSGIQTSIPYDWTLTGEVLPIAKALDGDEDLRPFRSQQTHPAYSEPVHHGDIDDRSRKETTECGNE